MEKWDQYHEDKRIKKKKQDVEMWEETVGEAAHNKIHMKDQIHTELQIMATVALALINEIQKYFQAVKQKLEPTETYTGTDLT